MSRSSKTAIWKRVRPFLGQTKYRAGAPIRFLQQWSTAPFSWLHGGPRPAICRLHQQYDMTPEIVLAGYAQGIFPTGEPNNRIVWHCPNERAVIATDKVHVSKRLKGYLRKERFQIGFDRQFAKVLDMCSDRKKTWITPQIKDAYVSLHEMGFGHSVEAYLDDRLVGGGYGVAVGRMFFLESMFCREDHASKIAFVHLAEKLLADGFAAIDCQFMTEHWRRFGARSVSPDEFQKLVVRDLHRPAEFSQSALEAGVSNSENKLIGVSV